MPAPRKTLALPQHTHVNPPQSTPAHAQAAAHLQDALRILTTPSDEPQAAILSRALSRTIRASTVLKRACAAVKE